MCSGVCLTDSVEISVAPSTESNPCHASEAQKLSEAERQAPEIKQYINTSA